MFMTDLVWCMFIGAAIFVLGLIITAAVLVTTVCVCNAHIEFWWRVRLFFRNQKLESDSASLSAAVQKGDVAKVRRILDDDDDLSVRSLLLRRALSLTLFEMHAYAELDCLSICLLRGDAHAFGVLSKAVGPFYRADNLLCVDFVLKPSREWDGLLDSFRQQPLIFCSPRRYYSVYDAVHARETGSPCISPESDLLRRQVCRPCPYIITATGVDRNYDDYLAFLRCRIAFCRNGTEVGLSAAIQVVALRRVIADYSVGRAVDADHWRQRRLAYCEGYRSFVDEAGDQWLQDDAIKAGSRAAHNAVPVPEGVYHACQKCASV